jgi:hypothetical protein
MHYLVAALAILGLLVAKVLVPRRKEPLAPEPVKKAEDDETLLVAGNEVLAKLSTRKKQAYAAMCLARFCAVKQIRHPVILQLIEHCLSLLISECLPEWEHQGRQLEFYEEKGDRLPASIRAILPEDISERVFSAFVETVVEVGRANMYAAETMHPLRFLVECINNLETHGVKPPSVDFILSVPQRPAYGAWGARIDAGDYERVAAECGKIWAE